MTTLRLRWGTALTLTVGGLFGVAAVGWPLLITPSSHLSEGLTGPWLFAGLLPLVLAAMLVQISEGGLDAKAVAMLGVLSAVIAAVRPFGAGTAGVETVFFLLLLAGRVYGPGFGFVLGNTALFASALLTGGVGPWLPFQMLGAAFFALGAGLLPRARGWWELVMLSGYGAVASLGFGLMLNLSFWPYAVSDGSPLSYEAGASVAENLSRLVAFNLATSLGWDIGRAITTTVLILTCGPVLLRVFRRAARKARWHNETRPVPRVAEPAGSTVSPS
ncbi:ECF transporter S component [Stackebrandtia nassauensis]|uniref:Integral membrane protein n=1 Tax=Stackebrandtia nassauensis (strain DSM 44728 / CIP 108903 / NRRL B-16338 / NBRC 102104 / LLR-40K-21) TaxID=446470 RepID=D3QAK0_STANL|nr:ECF transporter S component [Stackebrandtia nassauensis]ADD42783.1 hypothetical protein Snas_3112 [Stackebrandtia nassauensis DSM 44728]